jgi:hypothetical protein
LQISLQFASSPTTPFLISHASFIFLGGWPPFTSLPLTHFFISAIGDLH